MIGAFIVNKYYSDGGMEYVFQALCCEFAAIGAKLIRCSPNISYDGKKILTDLNADFAIFWDKNISLAHQIENSGIRVFNCARAIEICDDKQRTYAAISRLNIPIPKTVCAPIMYDNRDETDQDFLQFVESSLNYPIVVKENVGSQGRQVFLASNNQQLQSLYQSLKHKNHHYQQLTGNYGEDLRLYMVGGTVAAVYKRKGSGFKSNLADKGSACAADADQKTIERAQKIADCLGLDFGAVDFLVEQGESIFLEANSSAYFMGAEQLGFKVAQKIAAHIAGQVKK